MLRFGGLTGSQRGTEPPRGAAGPAGRRKIPSCKGKTLLPHGCQVREQTESQLVTAAPRRATWPPHLPPVPLGFRGFAPKLARRALGATRPMQSALLCSLQESQSGLYEGCRAGAQLRAFPSSQRRFPVSQPDRRGGEQQQPQEAEASLTPLGKQRREEGFNQHRGSQQNKFGCSEAGKALS